MDFETKIIAKRNIAALLRAELSKKNYEPRHIAIGTATDCYQPVERQLRLTRSVLEAAWDAGARSAFYHVVRLPWEVSPLFRQWLQLHDPQRAGRIMARIQEMRGGKGYDSDFATRMTGSGPWAELIAQRFHRATRKLGFNREPVALDTTAFRRPPAAGQGNLFG